MHLRQAPVLVWVPATQLAPEASTCTGLGPGQKGGSSEISESLVYGKGHSYKDSSEISESLVYGKLNSYKDSSKIS